MNEREKDERSRPDRPGQIVIPLLYAPQLAQQGAQWVLTLWVADPGDLAYSFRDLLAKIRAVLDALHATSVQLPPEVPIEDFVAGTLQWGDAAYRLYFERSLGFFELSSPCEARVREVLAAISPAVFWYHDLP